VRKNGKYFTTVIRQNQYKPSIWDPYLYRDTAGGHSLSQFVTVQRAGKKAQKHYHVPFRSIEYRDILGGECLSFALEREEHANSHPVVEENTILFGTMRAYLGNIVVTPLAEWVNQKAPLYFTVKSEFFAVYPFDELHYFWLIYFRSKKFTESLPVGSGGTRPRLTIDSFEQTPVDLPDLQTRRKIHEKIKELACAEWKTRIAVAETVNSLLER
jgi:hypothetical protein